MTSHNGTTAMLGQYISPREVPTSPPPKCQDEGKSWYKKWTSWVQKCTEVAQQYLCLRPELHQVDETVYCQYNENAEDSGHDACTESEESLQQMDNKTSFCSNQKQEDQEQDHQGQVSEAFHLQCSNVSNVQYNQYDGVCGLKVQYTVCNRTHNWQYIYRANVDRQCYRCNRFNHHDHWQFPSFYKHSKFKMFFNSFW